MSSCKRTNCRENLKEVKFFYSREKKKICVNVLGVSSSWQRESKRGERERKKLNIIQLVSVSIVKLFFASRAHVFYLYATGTLKTTFFRHISQKWDFTLNVVFMQIWKAEGRGGSEETQRVLAFNRKPFLKCFPKNHNLLLRLHQYRITVTSVSGEEKIYDCRSRLFLHFSLP